MANETNVGIEFSKREIYEGLRDYQYSDSELEMIESRYGLDELASLLLASKKWALRRSDPKWSQWKLDAQYAVDKQHNSHGERMQFCRHCGEIIFYPFPERREKKEEKSNDNSTTT